MGIAFLSLEVLPKFPVDSNEYNIIKVHHLDAKSKAQNEQSKHLGSPSPKKFTPMGSVGKVKA